jgi:chromate transport protein ChrA
MDILWLVVAMLFFGGCLALISLLDRLHSEE